jgi:hypothetical protein
MSIKTFAAASLTALTLATATFASAGTAEAAYGRNAAFFGGLATGLIVGGIAGAAAAPAYGYAAPRRVCSLEERYNAWGDYIGTRRVCRVVY